MRNHPKHHLQFMFACALVIAALGSACSKKDSPQPTKPEPVAFKAEAPIPVTFTLQKKEGQTGRASPIGNNYRPQVRFALEAQETTCAVRLTAPAQALEPGESANASLVCIEEVRIGQNQREFVAFEGGKQVGQGLVQQP